MYIISNSDYSYTVIPVSYMILETEIFQRFNLTYSINWMGKAAS